MLNEEYILKVIRHEINIFRRKYGKFPNTIILGKEILNILRAYNAAELVYHTDEPNTLYGIPVSINYAEPLVFEIGLIKRISIEV